MPQWKQSKNAINAAAGEPVGLDGWYKEETDGTVTIVTKSELTAWEKLQRTPDGKDALRGVKLKARLDGVIASRAADVEQTCPTCEPIADATGTP